MAKSRTTGDISDLCTSMEKMANVNLTGDEENQPNDPPSAASSSSQSIEENLIPDQGGPQKQNLQAISAPAYASVQCPILPITKSREKLVSLIENNSVVVIRGATGSGKTTQLPQYILDHYMDKNISCNIVVTQPRKIGARSIARWVSTQRKSVLGSEVGYQVGTETIASEHTRLTYMTTGVLLQKIVSKKSLTKFTHIFVDEIHERTEDIDFLLLILRRLLCTNSKYVKVILMSATIDCMQFAEYFSSVICGKRQPAYIFEVEGAPFEIDEFYLDDLFGMFPLMRKAFVTQQDDPCITPAMYEIAVSLIKKFDELEGKDPRNSDSKTQRICFERGSVLVFLPGLHEINCMQEALTKFSHKRLQIYPLHSSATQDEQNGVFNPSIPGYRKVILSTNIAESSVTVPDVKYVIDFCLMRRLFLDPETNYQSLRLTWASKTNCNQRRGRAGRVSRGTCYRLVTKTFWRKEIPDHMIPEMLLAPLSSTILKVKLLDMGDPSSVLATAMSPPDFYSISRTVLQLKELGALSVTGSDSDGELTYLGEVLAHLPVDLYLGKLIVLGHVFGCLDECLIIAASHSLKSFFAIPAMQQLAGHRSKLAFAQDTKSDCLAFVYAFKAWDLAKKNGTFRESKAEQHWGRENFIQIKRMREVADLYEDLKKRVAKFNMHVDKESLPYDDANANKQRFILQVVIAGAFYPNYFVQSEIDESFTSRELCGMNPKTTVMVKNLPPYSFLYHKQLQSLFRLYGQIKTIFFENSRAYLEFSSTSQGNQVLPEVQLALLMGQQPSTLELSVYPTELVERAAGRQPITHMKYARVKVDIKTQSINPMGVLSSTIDLSQLPPTRTFEIHVTSVVNVGHFWAFPADEKSLLKQYELTAAINSCTLCPLTNAPHLDLLCLAPYSEKSVHHYYRAKIKHIRGNSVEVFFVDFGNTDVVLSNCLRVLPPNLLKEPFLAREFQLAGLRPSAQSLIQGNPWSTQANITFKSLVKNQLLMATLYSIQFGIMRIDRLIDLESSQTNVLDELVAAGHAVKKDESHDSKHNHELLMSLFHDRENGINVSNFVGDSVKQRSHQEKELIESLCVSIFEKPSRKVHLHGPTSPHQSSFYCMNQKTLYKTVSLEKNSVNNPVLCENPQDKHQKLLVARFVSVNSTGNSLLLRDLSLMPDIPGLPMLLTMLFTPVMELRTNEERTSYIGALCGLGCDRKTRNALYPDRDIELTFDVNFDVDDITEINALRRAVNNLCRKTIDNPHQEHVAKMKEDCLDTLIRLCSKFRPTAELSSCLPETPGQWKQVPSSESLADEDKGEGRALFKLHQILFLDN